MQQNTTTARFGREIGKVRFLYNRRVLPRIALTKLARPLRFRLHLTPVQTDTGAIFYLDARINLKFRLSTGEVRKLSVQADTGSQYLVLMGDSFPQCTPEGGVFPVSEPAIVPFSEMEFTYGNGTYTGSFYRTKITSPSSPAFTIQAAVVTSATPCRSYFPEVGLDDTTCNDSVAGLLPTPDRASSESMSFLDQILGSLPKRLPFQKSFMLNFREGKEKVVFGDEDPLGIRVPFLSAQESLSLFGESGHPYYTVKLSGGHFVPDKGKSFSVVLPSTAILDSGTTLLAASTFYSEGATIGRTDAHPEATMVSPTKNSILGAGSGTLFLEFGNGAFLSAYVPGPELGSRIFSPLTMMNAAPFDSVLLIGLIAMRNHALCFNLKEKYVSFRSFA